MDNKLLTISFLFILIFIFPSLALAQIMSNNSYKIKMGNLNSISGNVSGSGYKLSETSGETAPGLYSGTNYKVKAGFQYARGSKIPFSFTISQNLIDFGTLSPTNPVSRTTNLTISSGQSSGFTIVASENNPLTSSNSTISDTTCDNGDCNTTKGAIWTGALTYGFGYRCDPSAGSGQANYCSSDFVNADYFKPFSVSPNLQTIMSSIRGGVSKKSQITYKVNISAAQPAGTYTNFVTYIASPGF